MEKKVSSGRSESQMKHGANRKLPKVEKFTEMKVCGIHACLAIFRCRPTAIIRVYVTEDRLNDFTHVLKYCAEQKLAYRVVSREELDQISESTHHEGVAMLMKRPQVFTVREFLAGEKDDEKDGEKPTCVVALENVQNPHNLGAIMRVCAHFGVSALLLSGDEPALSGSAYRTSAGGAEWLRLVTCNNLAQSVTDFKRAGYTVFATSSHGGESVFRSRFPRRSLILFGSEGEGLGEQLVRMADALLCISGTGHVESLNVACAASVVLASFWKDYGEMPSKDGARSFGKRNSSFQSQSFSVREQTYMQRRGPRDAGKSTSSRHSSPRSSSYSSPGKRSRVGTDKRRGGR